MSGQGTGDEVPKAYWTSESTIDSMIRLALNDAGRNCEQGGVALITLRSGAQFEGFVGRPDRWQTTIHIEQDPGWTTLLIEEIAAVTVKAKKG